MQILYIGALFALILFQTARIKCYPDDFMGKKPGGEPFVCPCEYDFEPVCGSDGITYINKCLLDCYNGNEIKKGREPVTECSDGVTCEDCVCQSISLPVCTVDGETYSNECEMTCENQRRVQKNKPLAYLAYRAPCVGSPCSCTNIASPVCGSDDIQYRNICELNCASANVETKGKPPIEFSNIGDCLDACRCPDISDPVCGSDGNEYKNLCELACQNRKQTCSLNGPVVPASDKNCRPCKCPNKYEPVCGSDGKLEPRTFPNMCELNCEARRRNNPYLSVIAFGVCSSCFCTGQHLPVCGTDCKTYTNVCELRCANNRRSKGDPRLSVFHPGPCQVLDCDCSHCKTDYEPVCGSDDVTYYNICWLNCNNNCSKKQNGKQISLASKGFCSLR